MADQSVADHAVADSIAEPRTRQVGARAACPSNHKVYIVNWPKPTNTNSMPPRNANS